MKLLNFENEGFPVFDSQLQDIEYILHKFHNSGIHLNDKITINDLKDTDFWYDKDMDSIRGKELAFELFELLSMSIEIKPSRESLYTSKDLFNFPADFGSEVRYNEIFMNLIRITKIDFTIEDVKNIFNETENHALLEFRFNQQHYVFKMKINNHYIDWDFFIQFGAVFKTYLHNSFYILGGDRYILFYSDENSAHQINNFICSKSGIEKLILEK